MCESAHVWLFPTVHFQMCPQSSCMNRCKVTLVAFVWLFSTVYFQMCPQSAYMNRCKVTLVAFVWLFTFTTVHFQMSPQMVCTRRGIITLVAFVWLFSTVHFQMFFFFKLLAWEDTKTHWLHLFGFSPLRVFKCIFKALALLKGLLQWSHMKVSPMCWAWAGFVGLFLWHYFLPKVQ